MKGEKLLLATIVYDRHIGLFKDVCLRSLFQSENIPYLIEAGYDARYIIYTRSNPDAVELEKAVAPYKAYGIEFEIKVVSEATNDALMREMISDGIKESCRLLFLNPDYFFANKALKHLVSYRAKNKMCIASTHVRVNEEEFIDKIKDVEGDVSSAQLVTMGMECLHESWRGSFIDKESNNSFTTGSMVEQIDEKLWAATFRIPTVFCAQFEQTDLDFFKMFNYYDHEWPSKLMEEHRFKFAGSSDFFFAVELTRSDENLPCKNDDMLWNDTFHVERKKHPEVNRNFLVILRGE